MKQFVAGIIFSISLLRGATAEFPDADLDPSDKCKISPFLASQEQEGCAEIEKAPSKKERSLVSLYGPYESVYPERERIHEQTVNYLRQRNRGFCKALLFCCCCQTSKDHLILPKGTNAAPLEPCKIRKKEDTGESWV